MIHKQNERLYYAYRVVLPPAVGRKVESDRRSPISEGYGGSYPPGHQGLQRIIRQVPRNDPRTAPYFRTDSTKYVLHVGVKRQRGPNMGLIKYW